MDPRIKEPFDVELPYPVLEERSLAYVPRKLLRGARRELRELPEPRPGCVFVFRHGARYVAFSEAKHLTGAEEPVVDATAVCLVDTRVRSFTVQFPVPSASPADDFTVRANFHARVTDAGRAAEEGPIDLRRYLAGYLAQDPKLAKLGGNYLVEDIATVRDLIVSRIEAYCELNHIDLPGLAIKVASASVLTPHELRIHERAKRDERRRQEIGALQASGEDAQIVRHKEIVDAGPSALTALGLARGETSVHDAIENSREDQQNQQAQLAEAFRVLQQSGVFDILDVDASDIAHAYFEKLTGKPISRPGRRGLRGHGGENPDAIGSGFDDEDDEAPDEADLDE